MNKEELIERAKQVEPESYFPVGREIDGAPYSWLNTDTTFFREAVTFFGEGQEWRGYQWLAVKVRERRENGEELADEECGNWWVWTIFNELGVSRVKK